MNKFLRDFKNILLPPDFKRPYSIAAYILSVILTLIFTGILTEAGKWIFDELLLKNAKKFSVPIIDFIFKPFSTNLLLVVIYSILFIVIAKYIERKFIKKKEGILIFKDDFESIGSGWFLNYWGSKNPSKTNRIEKGNMIFEAVEDELENKDKEFGAYYDLSSGIYEGNEYEILCKVKSEPDTTMKFQLWIHDDIRGVGSKIRSRYPEPSRTPKNSFEIIKARFIANGSNAMRIHLHNKGGLGKIIVDEIKVIQI